MQVTKLMIIFCNDFSEESDFFQIIFQKNIKISILQSNFIT